MKTSVPEQAIFYYVKKYVDSFASNNVVRIAGYTADVTFLYNGVAYDVEYDAYSTHSGRLQNDIQRDKVFQDSGYSIIRMRDRGLVDVPGVINITFDFQDYRKKSILTANKGINQFLSLFDVEDIVDIGSDLDKIRTLYYEKIH